jgi:hypothetical protein
MSKPRGRCFALLVFLVYGGALIWLLHKLRRDTLAARTC